MKYPLRICYLIVLICCMRSVAPAQTLASSNQPPFGLLPRQKEHVKSLKQALDDLEKAYNVSIAYKSELIESKEIVWKSTRYRSVEEALENVLKAYELTYKKAGDNFYIIIAEPAGRQDLDKIEGRSILSQDNELMSVGGETLPTIDQAKMPVTTPQDFAVSGKVTSETGEGLPGVSILIKGTATGTATGADGSYTLRAPDGNATLVFSYIGYITEEAAVNNQTVVNVVLMPNIESLSEVVVVGYGTQRRQDVTGAISSIKANDIRPEGANTIQKALQGRVAGVQVESAGGNPGSGVRILVRGAGSFNNNTPLYIVDGIQVGDINNLSPTDIASMDILKDASAAAIYGSRASNGVVLITTKSGKKGENRIEFNANYGVQQITKKLDVLNAAEWARVSNAAHDAAGIARLDIAKNAEALGAPGTDWQKEIYRVAPTQNYTLSASGGGENYTYSISGGYLDQNGIVKKTNYNRLNFRIKSDFTKGRIKIGETVILTREYWRNMAGGWGGQGGNPVGSAIKMIPAFNVYDSTAVGGYGGAYGPVVNIASPVAQLNLEVPENRNTTILFNAFAELTILDGLKYKFNLGYTPGFNSSYSYTHPYKVGALFVNVDSDLSETRGQSDFFLQEHTLNYSKSFDKHKFDVLVGYTYQNEKYRGLTGSKSGMPNGVYVLDAGITNITSSGNARENALLSYLGRLVYSFDDRYVLTATMRQDGSSRFGKAHTYGNFPSVALAWNAVNESFFQPLSSVISNLKVRASYGLLGNQSIGDYQYDPMITLNTNYVTGQDQHLWPGSIQTTLANRDIHWETTKTFNVGTDWGFFDNKLSLTADYFTRTSEGALISIPVPLSTGANNMPVINAGTITNKGLELALNYGNTISDFTYNVMGTFTAIDNKVSKLGTGTQQIAGGQPTFGSASATIGQAGLPVGAFYLIKTNGIFNSDGEVEAHNKDGVKIQPNAKPGDIRFVDANNDGKIDQNDRQYVGSPAPTFSYGLGGNVAWKGFDLNIFFQGTQGNKIYNGMRQDLEGISLEQNYGKATLNAWTAANPTDFPRAVINDPNGNSQTSNRFLENGSYLRFKTLQLGYTLPKSVLSTLKVSSLRVYVSGDNLVTFTKYKGYNPDLGRTDSILNRGIDFGYVAYPLSRTLLAGLQLSF